MNQQNLPLHFTRVWFAFASYIHEAHAQRGIHIAHSLGREWGREKCDCSLFQFSLLLFYGQLVFILHLFSSNDYCFFSISALDCMVASFVIFFSLCKMINKIHSKWMECYQLLEMHLQWDLLFLRWQEQVCWFYLLKTKATCHIEPVIRS